MQFHFEPLAENVFLNEDGTKVCILDQTLLPNVSRTLKLQSPEEIREAICQLRVRGAPAIGIFAGYALFVLARQIKTQDTQEFLAKLHAYREYLVSSRPTAVNLGWALERMEKTAVENAHLPVEEIVCLLGQQAVRIQKEDIEMCRAISENGLSLLANGAGILTHCNAGPLATSRYGTALGPLLLGKERGMQFHVFCDETRPLLQGARLTAYELQKAGIDATLLCDNMVAAVMQKGWIDACLVGCDRVAANGDTANKIGTSGVAILAKYYGVPFYVLGPTSSIDLSCKTGEEIAIELRDPEEIRLKFYREPMAPAGVKCYNPAFDVTDHSLITGIITQRGVCRPPYTESLAALFENERGGET